MDFTSKQKEIVARKLGYDGPMQGFDQYLQSSPALMMKYNAVTDKYAQKMAKGGIVNKKKFATGGTVTSNNYTQDQINQLVKEAAAQAGGTLSYTDAVNAAANLGISSDQIKAAASTGVITGAPSFEQDQVNQLVREAAAQAGGTLSYADAVNAAAKYNVSPEQIQAAASTGVITGAPTTTTPTTPTENTGGVTSGGNVTYTDIGGKPIPADAAQVTASKITEDTNQIINTSLAPTDAKQTTANKVTETSKADAPTSATASTYDATNVSTAVKDEISKLTAAQGQVSQQAQAVAATKEPTTTALADLQAAQLAQAQQVQAPQERTLQQGELVSGSAVDQQRMDQLIEQTKADAAQGVVTEDMTVQGQLAKLTANFDATNPPGWAAGALRAATATMAARGIGASSMAGQALIQATIESALPIATSDAKVYQDMAAQNLSNRQQTAMLAAQQRAQFLGQEFDQNFQSRVLNAAKVADIANTNFTAQQQIALENARLAQSVDLANLSNRQATVMATAAQIATLETQNLSNLQQAAVQNAQAFLQMDMKNLDNAQQTSLFKTQQVTAALLSDQAANNAAKQFNASSATQAAQFNAQLASQVSQFNAAQSNAIAQFNIDQVNSINKFNAEAQNAREQFNAQSRLIIDQSNAQWRREISTANTAADNAANYINAQNLQQMTLAEYNNETQLYRDQVKMAFDSFENDQQRLTTLAAATISATASTDAASSNAKSKMWEAVGSLAVSIDW